MTDTISYHAQLMQKNADLPRYVEIPASHLELWEIKGTTPIEVQINGKDIGRRNLKHWGSGRDTWFFEVTQQTCKNLGIKVGDHISITLKLADTNLPQELAEILDVSPEANTRWDSMSSSKQRMLADYVRSAKQVDTKIRRAKKALMIKA